MTSASRPLARARRPSRPALRGAVLSLACLPAGLLLAFATMKALDLTVPSLQARLGPALFFIVLGAWSAAAAALWGHLLTAERRAALGAALGFGLAAPAVVWGLTAAETALLLRAQEGAEWPMHLVFGAIFPLATSAVVLATTLGLLLGAGLGARALPPALRCALAAGAAFAVVAVAMDLAGWRVGAPGAEARFTMLVVMASGLLASTVVAGALLERQRVTKPG